MFQFLRRAFVAATFAAIALTGGFTGIDAHAQATMKPFVLAERTTGDVETITNATAEKLKQAGFEVVGTYAPYANARVIAVTNDAIKNLATQSELGGFGAVQRASITKVGDRVQVAFTNPPYMAAAYRMEGTLQDTRDQLAAALGDEGEFGPSEGMSADELNDYHYMFLMPYFDDPNLLGTAESHEAMVKRIEANLAANTAGTTKVYRVDLPGKEEVVFGVGLKGQGEAEREKDDAWIMSEIDFKDTRSTAHLPIEIVVSGNKAWALDTKFRIAINFSDLSMSGDNSFMNIMGSPGAIQEALTLVAGGTYRGEGKYAN